MAQAVDDCLNAAVLMVDSHRRIGSTSGNLPLLARLPITSGQSIDDLPPSLARFIHEALDTAPAAPAGRRLMLPTEGPDAAPIHAQILPHQGTIFVFLHDLAPIRKIESDTSRHIRLASIGSITASMAHEIKNALVAIKTLVELLLSRHHEEPALGELVGREFRRIDSMITQMLRLSDRTKGTFVPLSIHSSLEHALRLLEHQLARKQIRVIRDFSAASDQVQGDDFQLEQAFLNLFLNALDAMSAPGRLTISTGTGLASPQEPLLLVSIADSGNGVLPENLHRLFEPFFTTKPHGTGLGLSITRRIIEEHGGSIHLDAGAEQGSTFRIALPLLDQVAG
jgi:signal transduction histidine kinase